MAQHLLAELVATLVFAQRALAPLDEESAQFWKQCSQALKGPMPFEHFAQTDLRPDAPSASY